MLSRVSCFSLCVTPWIVTCQAPLSVEFSKQEYWSGLPFPPPGDLPGPGIKPMSLVSPALTDRFFTTNTTFPYTVFEKKNTLLHLIKYQMHRMISMMLK